MVVNQDPRRRFRNPVVIAPLPSRRAVNRELAGTESEQVGQRLVILVRAFPDIVDEKAPHDLGQRQLPLPGVIPRRSHNIPVDA